MKKKKLFISFRFTGEDPEVLENTIPKIHEAIDRAGHHHYSTYFDNPLFEKEAWSAKEILNKAFNEMDSSDLILFVVLSPEISQGMLIELGYALAKNKNTLLVIKSKIKESIFRDHIDDVIEFEDLRDLAARLEKLSL